MNVLVISCHPLQDNRISKMIESVKKSGNKITYINISTQQETPLDWFEEIEVIKFYADFSKKYLLNDIIILNRIKKIIKRVRPDIVHVHDPYLIPLLKCSKKYGAKTVFDKHEAYEIIDGFAGKTGAICERLFHSYIDGIVYVSTSQESHINTIGYKAKAWIPNYQSEKAFNQVNCSEHDTIRLFYAGDLSDVSRNTTVMLQLIESILKKYNNTECTIAGRTSDPRIHDRIMDMENRLSRFHYCNYMLYDDVIKNTKNSDIGLYLTKYDRNNIGSSPNKINEYLLAGIAIFSQGRFADWESINGVAGQVYGYDATIEELFDGLCYLIDNPCILSKMKNESAIIGKERTWESIENRYIQLYECICNC